ncbi:hypothetical protein [uncultured Sphingomonas sp.]|uniref:hypothetical protein n=1 Tax=uncultured Sphingomonas sp. TaxID=158754 RepID=UPI0025DA9426|nr:hypothetical protein [uncultured Sphingomonas sp.]
MPEAIGTKRDNRGLPDTPRDLPMPAYRYQEEERFGRCEDVTGPKRPDAATLLRGAGLMGCAASTPYRD